MPSETGLGRAVAVWRRLLAAACTAAGVLACVFLFAIGALILAQVVARIFGGIVPSAIDLAAFSMAASTFLGLAYTLRDGAHIRVLLAIDRLPVRAQRIVEIVNTVAGTLLFAFLTYQTAAMAITSFQFGDVSIGFIPIPLWIPQSGLVLGSGLMTLALLDEAVALVAGAPTRFSATAPGAARTDPTGEV